MKSLIRGIDILLYSGSTTETVSNVLVGQPITSLAAEMTQETGVQQSYTIAIPKGDTHDWTSRIVEFFGERFRTVGYPIQGIEENIPLCWHKQVNVQRLDVTGSCTIYSKVDYGRHIIDNVYAFNDRGSAPEIGVNIQKGALHVHIYADRAREDSYIPTIGDIIVDGECDFEFDTSSQESTSQSMKEFRESGAVFGVIGELGTVSYGSLPDFIITAN